MSTDRNAPPTALEQLPQTVPERHAVIALPIERARLLKERVNILESNGISPSAAGGGRRVERPGDGHTQ